jgi:hypothetical protein
MSEINFDFLSYDNGIMTYEDFVVAKAAFNRHYFTAQSQRIKGCIDVEYDTLQNLVSSYSSGNVGLTFIHRFDPHSNDWYVCVELCLISDDTTPDPATGRDVSVKQQLPGQPRYDIRNNGNVSTSTLLNGYVDVDYFNNVYFADSIGSSQIKLSTLDPGHDIFVQAITFPWREIVRLYTDNIPSGQYDTAIVSIQACSSNIPSQFYDANLQWPHSIWMFMKNRDSNGVVTSLFGPGDGDDSSFTNNAADVGSMCPPRCGVYIKPPYSKLFTRFYKKFRQSRTS